MTTGQSLYDEIIEGTVDDLIHEYSGKELKKMDEMELDTLIHDFSDTIMQNMTTYDDACRNIIFALKYDVFAEHDMFGRPRNYRDAAYNALWDAVNDQDYTYGFILGDVRIKLKLND